MPARGPFCQIAEVPSSDQPARDRDRDADLAAAGWIVLRFTYRAITMRPKATADRIAAAVARWR